MSPLTQLKYLKKTEFTFGFRKIEPKKHRKPFKKIGNSTKNQIQLKNFFIKFLKFQQRQKREGGISIIFFLFLKSKM